MLGVEADPEIAVGRNSAQGTRGPCTSTSPGPKARTVEGAGRKSGEGNLSPEAVINVYFKGRKVTEELIQDEVSELCNCLAVKENGKAI